MKYFHGTNNENILAFDNKQKKKRSDFVIRLYNENLKKMIYYKNENGIINEITRQKISFLKEKNKIIKKEGKKWKKKL